MMYVKRFVFVEIPSFSVYSFVAFSQDNISLQFIEFLELLQRINILAHVSFFFDFEQSQLVTQLGLI